MIYDSHMCGRSQSFLSVNVPALFAATKTGGEHACSHLAKQHLKHLSTFIPMFSPKLNSL